MRAAAPRKGKGNATERYHAEKDAQISHNAEALGLKVELVPQVESKDGWTSHYKAWVITDQSSGIEVYRATYGSCNHAVILGFLEGWHSCVTHHGL